MSEEQSISEKENVNTTSKEKSGVTIKPSKTQRQEAINSILREDLLKEKQKIKSTSTIIERLNRRFSKDFPDYKYKYNSHQSLISKDLRALGFKAKGRGSGFLLTKQALKKDIENEVRTIFKLAQTKENDILTSVSSPLIIRIRGYGNALAKTLKKICGDKILEIIPLESSIILYCTSKDNREIIRDMLKKVIIDDDYSIDYIKDTNSHSQGDTNSAH